MCMGVGAEYPVAKRVETGENGSDRGQRMAGVRDELLNQHAFGRESIDGRTGLPGVPVAVQPVGPQRVDHQEEDIRESAFTGHSI